MAVYIIHHIHCVTDSFSDKKGRKAHIYEHGNMIETEIVTTNLDKAFDYHK